MDRPLGYGGLRIEDGAIMRRVASSFFRLALGRRATRTREIARELQAIR